MITLSLKEFALAVGAEPKWVLNAAARLGRPFDYTDSEAKWLRLARTLNHDLRIPLAFAAELAGRAATAGGEKPARLADVPGGGIRLTVDLVRHESTFQAALAAAIALGAPRRAGRKPRPPAHYRAAIGRAWRLGISVGRLRGIMGLPIEVRLGGRWPPADRRAVPASGRTDDPSARVVEMMRVLRRAKVRGVLTGELAEVIRGARPVRAEPCVDLCYERSPANCRRVARMLRAVAARAGPTDGPPDAATLGAAPSIVVTTRLGPLILRNNVPGVGDFADVEREAGIINVLGVDATVLELGALRRARLATGTRTDMERLPVLDTLIAIPAVDARRREVAMCRSAGPAIEAVVP